MCVCVCVCVCVCLRSCVLLEVQAVGMMMFTETMWKSSHEIAVNLFLH